jgi:hypothetical protein
LFHLTLDQTNLLRFQSILSLRIDSKISRVEMKKRIDQAVSSGGLGLYSQTAEKMSREVEIIMLLKYS